MKLIFVEDGSVNVDELEKKTKGIAEVVVYRQNSEKPFMVEVQDIREQMQFMKDKIYKDILSKAKQFCNNITMDDSLEISKHELYQIIFGEDK